MTRRQNDGSQNGSCNQNIAMTYYCSKRVHRIRFPCWVIIVIYDFYKSINVKSERNLHVRTVIRFAVIDVPMFEREISQETVHKMRKY